MMSAQRAADEPALDEAAVSAVVAADDQEEPNRAALAATTGSDGQDSTTAATETGEATDEPIAEGVFLPPIRLAIPALDFATEVEPMAWQVTDVDGKRQAVWQVPDSTAGWHINSAGVGAADNLLISGHHRLGTAVFAPMARGELALDDELYVTDEAGRTFVYQVSELVPPIPVSGATEAERAQLNSYLAPTTEGRLTLLTGWPDFSDTHYLIIVARLVKELE